MAGYERHRSHRRMTREEAERLFEIDARDKDFWSLDAGEDNREMLQEAMDVVYNIIPGNKYEIDYQEHQNTCRLIVRCVTCGKDLSSFDPFITHEKGKPHKKVRQQMICPKDPNIKVGLQKQPHNLLRGIFNPGSLEDKIDRSNYPIVGAHFVYKEEMDKPHYTCALCRHKKGSKVEAVCQNKMLKHLLGQTHTELYMKVKFNIEPQLGFEDLVIKYEEFEGRIHVPIIDFTKQMTLEVVKQEKIRTKKSCNLKTWGDIKMEIETKVRPKVKRERSSSGESPDFKRIVPANYAWSDDEEMRPVRPVSPKIWTKDEMASPTMSSPTMSPVREVIQPTYQDAETMTDLNEPVELTIYLLAEESANLKSPSGLDQLQEDQFMQGLICEAITVLNKKLAASFKRLNVMCWDEKGEIVGNAHECAIILQNRHLTDLQRIMQHER
ncbi:uncharacterized protein [Palaemon carinicauda]